VSFRVVRLGSPRLPGEGLRIGTVRRPPRGVPKERFAADDWYDVWFPNLSPSAGLVASARSTSSEKDWARFARAFRAELAAPERSRDLDLLAALSRQADFSIGCYCRDESRCHTAVLRELLLERGARASTDD
jgi:uncharacterized protein YeaO (DUF488 family)